MECAKVNEPIMNIENFSKVIGTNWNIDSDILRNYLFANISIALIKNNDMKKDINKLYNLDKQKYYNAANNSTCINHIIISQGTLEQEINARKVLGILLTAEDDYNLRSKVIKLLRKYYPAVFASVKQHNMKNMKINYTGMDDITREMESRLHAAIYFYFSIYRSADLVDQGCISSIINDMHDYEFISPMKANIENEIIRHKPEIDEIKAVIKEKYGKINNFRDILSSDTTSIQDYGIILENLFIINKLSINYTFSNSEYINIDKIILSYIKKGGRKLELDLLLPVLISCIFIQSLINEYKASKNFYFKNNQEMLIYEADSLEENFHNVEAENTYLKETISSLEKERLHFDTNLNQRISDLNKRHTSEINILQNRIKELENQLSEEKKYRTELNALREYIFEVNNDYVPQNINKTFESSIANKKILIIGGSKDWRRKFRDTYPRIRTLHGFNENFEINILNSYDYIFFYTGFINHATYYKAMNFIRTHQIKFGYIGKTNVELVKEELMEELQRLK